jgi:hypothetical protein
VEHNERTESLFGPGDDSDSEHEPYVPNPEPGGSHFLTAEEEAAYFLDLARKRK